MSNWVNKRRRGDKYAITGKSRGRKTGEKRIINEMLGKKIQDYIANTGRFVPLLLLLHHENL
ncbi:hypothetical protein [Rickettsia endosymbiont of Rhinocyllus conicus]|uniref:hypothetical protein n=1 Tax=Rickettsia endosymbiont of Rhinocyllus conicus TaxID=3066252 RepID=UPI0039787703